MDLMAVDPGLSGGLCFVKDGAVAQAVEMPTISDGSNRQVDVRAVCRLVDRWGPQYAVIENVQPMPSIPNAQGLRRGMGAASSFRFGFAVGQIRSVAVCYGMELRLIHSRVWKAHYKLVGPDKEQSRLLAIKLCPALALELAKKKSHNVAESVLLALYGRDTLGML